LVSSILSAAGGLAAPCLSIAVILIPLMALCACSFAKASDSALARAARCLGASRLRAFLTFTSPYSLKGILAAFVTVFLPAAGIALVSDQMPGTAAGFVLPISAALLLLTAAVISFCLHILRKARSVSPC
jgi:ABC-type spermidine/putrescine transport system permease subunit I